MFAPVDGGEHRKHPWPVVECLPGQPGVLVDRERPGTDGGGEGGPLVVEGEAVLGLVTGGDSKVDGGSGHRAFRAYWRVRLSSSHSMQGREEEVHHWLKSAPGRPDGASMRFGYTYGSPLEALCD